ncbi:MAG: hypothetical protein K2K02_08955 [Ruminococcus sp.]|nr:hypothetical protein [Ruminococcus sp.]
MSKFTPLCITERKRPFTLMLVLSRDYHSRLLFSLSAWLIDVQGFFISHAVSLHLNGVDLHEIINRKKIEAECSQARSDDGSLIVCGVNLPVINIIKKVRMFPNCHSAIQVHTYFPYFIKKIFSIPIDISKFM